MQFKAILGQEAIKAHLCNNVNNNRVSHAQLFLSADGSGALPLAIAYAQYVNCEQRSDTDSCGVCTSCRKYEKLIHPDLHFSYPFFASKERKIETATDVLASWREMVLENYYFDLDTWKQKLKGENKQININQAECHSIIMKLSYKAFEAKTKVLIMWLPEYLGKEGNTLLKLIEEPPANTLFILVARNQEQILNTILSRTQILKIPQIEENSVKEYLIQKSGLSEEQANEYSFLANGNLVEAERLLDGDSNNNNQFFIEWLRMSFKNDVIELINFTEKIAGWGREGQKNFVIYGVNFLRECSLLINNAENLVRLPPLQLNDAKSFVKNVLNQAMLEALVNELEKAYFHIERNANPKILFLDVSLQLVKIIKFKSLPTGTQYIYT